MNFDYIKPFPELKKLYDKWAQTLPPERTLRIDMDSGEYDLERIVRFLET